MENYSFDPAGGGGGADTASAEEWSGYQANYNAEKGWLAKNWWRQKFQLEGCWDSMQSVCSPEQDKTADKTWIKGRTEMHRSKNTQVRRNDAEDWNDISVSTHF